MARNLHGERLAEFIIAGIERAVLVTRVRTNPVVVEGCVDEIKRHVQVYRAG